MTAALLLSFVALSTASSPEVVVYDGYSPQGQAIDGASGDPAHDVIHWPIHYDLQSLKIVIKNGGDEEYRVLRTVSSELTAHAEGNVTFVQGGRRVHPPVHAVAIDYQHRVFRLPNVSEFEFEAKELSKKRIAKALKRDAGLTGNTFYVEALNDGTLQQRGIPVLVDVEIQQKTAKGWATIRSFAIQADLQNGDQG